MRRTFQIGWLEIAAGLRPRTKDARHLAQERAMKKKETKKLQLGKDTLRHLVDKSPLAQAVAGEPTTTVMTRWRTCTC